MRNGYLSSAYGRAFISAAGVRLSCSRTQHMSHVTAAHSSSSTSDRLNWSNTRSVRRSVAAAAVRQTVPCDCENGQPIGIGSDRLAATAISDSLFQCLYQCPSACSSVASHALKRFNGLQLRSPVRPRAAYLPVSGEQQGAAAASARVHDINQDRSLSSSAARSASAHFRSPPRTSTA